MSASSVAGSVATPRLHAERDAELCVAQGSGAATPPAGPRRAQDAPRQGALGATLKAGGRLTRP